MNRRLVLFLISWLVIAIPSVLKGQDQDSVAADTTYESKILVLPAIGSSPETGFLFGGLMIPQFKVGDAGAETRSSTILISAIYTLKNQILTGVIPDIILPNEAWVFNGHYSGNYFPESFWGIGPNTENNDEITTIYTRVNIEQNALKQIGKGLFVGPHIRWSKLYNVEFEDTNGNDN